MFKFCLANCESPYEIDLARKNRLTEWLTEVFKTQIDVEVKEFKNKVTFYFI